MAMVGVMELRVRFSKHLLVTTGGNRVSHHSGLGLGDGGSGFEDGGQKHEGAGLGSPWSPVVTVQPAQRPSSPAISLLRVRKPD